MYVTFFFITLFNECVHVSTTTHLWSSENNFQEFSPTTWALGIKPQVTYPVQQAPEHTGSSC